MRTPILLAVLLSACAPQGGVRFTADRATTFCVTNATVAYGVLRMYAGGQSMRVEPGQRECRYLSGAGWTTVAGATIGGGSRGALRVRDQIELHGGCWEWRVENVPGSFPMPCGDQ